MFVAPRLRLPAFQLGVATAYEFRFRLRKHVVRIDPRLGLMSTPFAC
jgi:hypothetical protein